MSLAEIPEVTTEKSYVTALKKALFEGLDSNDTDVETKNATLDAPPTTEIGIDKPVTTPVNSTTVLKPEQNETKKTLDKIKKEIVKGGQNSPHLSTKDVESAVRRAVKLDRKQTKIEQEEHLKKMVDRVIERIAARGYVQVKYNTS